MPKKTKTKTTQTHFERFSEAMRAFSTASNQLDALHAQSGAAIINSLGPFQAKFKTIQVTLIELKEELLTLVQKNPQWFDGKRQIKHPYGTVKIQASTRLTPEDEKESIARIQRDIHLKANGAEVGCDPALFLRHRTDLDLEALSKADDALLSRYGIKRETTDNITLTPLKPDLEKLPAK